MTTAEQPRTPLYAMTDAQLRFIATDTLQDWNRRRFAEMILLNRHQQQTTTDAFAHPRKRGTNR